MKRIYLLLFICLVFFTKAQVPVSSAFPQNFGTDLVTSPTFPTGWTTTVTALGEISLDDSFTPLSTSGGNVVVFNNTTTFTEIMQYASVSTNGFDPGTGITISWNMLYFGTNSPTVTVEWSSNGTTWNPITYVQPATTGAWYPCSSPGIPGAANLGTLFLRFSYLGDASSDYTLIDDVNILGDPNNQYTWDGVGAVEDPNSWLNAFTGATTLFQDNVDFSGNNYQYFLSDQVNASTTAVALTGNWLVNGTGATIILGDGLGTAGSGALPMNLTIPTGFTLSLPAAGILQVNDFSQVTYQNTIFPAASNLNLKPGSTVEYAQAASSTVTPMTYYNLIISGSGPIAHSSSVVTVATDLNLTSDFTMSNAASSSSLILNGTVSGSGALLTRTNSKLRIGGTGALGTLNFGDGGTGTPKTLSGLNINRTSSGTIDLGTDLAITSTVNLTSGVLNINANKLSLNGPINFNGSFFLGGSTTSSLNVGGASTGAINNQLLFDQTSASTRAMSEIRMNRSSKTLTLGNPVEIWGNITPTVGTIAAGSGNLTLKSDASNKGRVGQIGASGNLTGSLTVEVFRGGSVNTGWINLCSAGVNGQTFTNWASSFAITCTSCPISNSGTGITASIYSYNETLAAGSSSNAAAYIDLDALGGIGASINSKTGYYAYVGNTSPGTTTGPITISLTGGVNTKNSSGNITITKTGSDPVEDGWNLVANPFPSPIVGSQITGTNFNAASIQAYDPTTDSYPSYSAGTIPMGQAFFVQATANGNLTPAESWKVTANDNTGLLRTASAGGYYFDDFLLSLTSNIVPRPFYTQAYFTFGNAYTTNYENGDCLSFDGSIPGTPRIVARISNAKLKRAALPSLNGLTTIPILVETGYPGLYSINPINLNKIPSGACVTLFDIANNVSHNLRTGPYSVNIAANATTPQFELRITLVPTTLTSNFTNPQCKKVGNGILVAKGTTAGPWNYTWKDISNNTIITHNNVSTFDTLKNVAEGTYNVDVNTVGSCDNANAQFVLNATTPLPTALFTSNTSTVSANSNVPVSFTNNSANATNYSWSFGDGATASTANASHAYSNVGTFDVKLIATNGICADSSVAHSQITALAGPAVGINNNTLANNNALVSKDGDGVFVQLNFDAYTKTEITVTNILGQVITSKKMVVADKTKYYLSIPENEKIIFVTVEANNQKQTTKIIN